MAAPFATYSDLATRWRTLSAAEQSRATVLLSDASDLIRDLAPAPINEATAKAIVCTMVKRAMQGPADLDGVTQHQQTAGAFSQGVTFANPSGDLYLTKLEKQRLGIGRQRAFMVDLIPEPPTDDSSSSSS